MLDHFEMLRNLDGFLVGGGVLLILLFVKEVISLGDWFIVRFTKIQTKSRKQQDLTLRQQQQITQCIKNDSVFSEDLDKVMELLKSTSQKLDDFSRDYNETKIAELKERINQAYRYYKSRSDETGRMEWNELEADAFWDMYDSYTAKGGNSYVHSVIEPYMREFLVVALVCKTNK